MKDIYGATTALELAEKVRITSISTKNCGVPKFLSNFNNLTYLEILGDVGNPFEGSSELDMAPIFSNCQVNFVRLGASGLFTVRSFPPTVQTLLIFDRKLTLDQVTWTAVCNLQQLKTLGLSVKAIENWNQDLEFKSWFHLQSFFVTVEETATINFEKQIFKSMRHCSQLTSITLGTPMAPVSTNLAKWLVNTSKALSTLSVDTRIDCDESFKTLIEGAKRLINLDSLTLPWPYGPYPADAERWTENFQALADACHRLNIIEFRLKDSDEWEKFKLRNTTTNTTPIATTFDLLQSFKNTKFVPKTSALSPYFTLSLIGVRDTQGIVWEGIKWGDIAMVLDLDKVRQVRHDIENIYQLLVHQNRLQFEAKIMEELVYGTQV